MVTSQEGSQNLLSLPFADPNKDSWLISAIISVVAAVQIFTIFAVSTMYFLMLTLIKKSGNIIGSNTNSHSTVVVLRQIIILLLLKVVCWIPSSTIYITVLVMDKYHPLIIYWTTILIVPINAIVIPVVLSFTALKKIV